ncbi:hypothetical protein DFJ58DRAFT_728441 [Suillus subalutaceus]|uniref:uncharacterized protein n=1 Tax=Suillus subalutaceus TaxID=48586 RepID=UPI001B86C3EF|nr:uncharacterized protein DFJ58DRAFT_728441 [Suillus subalutaceus]KAG1852785.1 hypothetical protein DFJ58DRAFT_728441 [Suillus subalutaceus]
MIYWTIPTAQTLERFAQLIAALGQRQELSRRGNGFYEAQAVDVNNHQPEKRKKVQKLDTHILSTFDDDWYLDADEDENAQKGGAKMHPLLRKISKPCRLASDPTATKIVRCIASHGCNVTWAWPRARQRIMKHAVHEGPSMAKEWRKEAREYMAFQATGAKEKVAEAALDSDSNEHVLASETSLCSLSQPLP